MQCDYLHFVLKEGMKLIHSQKITHDELNFMSFVCMYAKLIHSIDESLGSFSIVL
jgi:hypothetical protein